MGKATVAGDRVLPPPSPPPVTQKYCWWKMYRGEGCSLLSENFALVFTLFFNTDFFYIHNWMLKQNLAFFFICTHLFLPSPQLPGISKLSVGKPGSLPEAWERGEEGEETAPVAWMCPAGNTGTLFLSDLFASPGQSLTEVLLKFFYSLKSKWFWLFVFVVSFLGAVTL